MKKITLKISYDEEKIKAIKIALSEKNKSFDSEIIKYLDGLYNKNVPKLLKKYIENIINIQDNVTDKSEQIKHKNDLEIKK